MNPEPVYDVVVIGSGVTGAVTAWNLARARLSVLLLEAGEESPPRDVLIEAYARATERTPGAPYSGREGDRKAPDPETDRKDYYQHRQEEGSSHRFLSTYLRRVGGSTWHFLGNVPRFLPNDFRLRTEYGRGVDWPLGYDDLEEDYTVAEALLGVSGDHEQWKDLFGAHRSRPFPMTKIWESYSDRRVKKHVETVSAYGKTLRVMSTPQARNARPYDGRPACAGNSSCVPICPIQAKYDATVHVAKAVAEGAELRARSIVTRIEPPTVGDQVGRVRYLDWQRVEHSVGGRIVVLAAHAIESAKILLLSGIANRSGQVGCNLMDHPQGAGGCLAEEPLYPMRGPPTTSGIDVMRDGKFRRKHAGFRMSLGNDGWGRIETPAETVARHVAAGLFGIGLRNAVRHDITRQFRISFSCEMLPDPSNRVTLGSESDGMGIPKPQLAFQVPAYTTDAFKVARKLMTRIFAAIGDSDPRFKPLGTDFTGAGHIMGTCRMGNSATSSVVDRDGRSHEHPNLFVIGSSVFPTSGTANPTLTALALALRANRAMLHDLREGRFAA